MPSRTTYKRKSVLRSPPELRAWFDSKKNWKNDPEMIAFRKEFTALSGNTDRDWSLFRAKMRGDVGLTIDEIIYIMDKTGVTRINGKPLWSGFNRQMDLLEIV